ncbi:MAG: GAF domain-containing protein [Candidatus Desantisbacteria bacterium]
MYLKRTTKNELSNFDRLLNWSVGIIAVGLSVFAGFFTRNLTFLIMSIFFLVVLLVLHNLILLRVRKEEQRSKEKADQLANLQEISMSLTSTLLLEEVFELLPSAGIKLAKVSACLVEMKDKKERLIPKSAIGINFSLSEIENEEEKSLGKMIVQGKIPLPVDNLQQKLNLPIWIFEQGFKSYLGIPLKVRDEVIGVIEFFSSTPRIFSKEEIEILSILGTQAASALENARLYGVTREALHKEITSSIALYKIEQSLTSKIELDEQISTLIEGCVHATGAEKGSLWLIDDLSGDIVCKTIYPYEDKTGEMRLKIGEGITGVVVKEGVLKNIPDLSQETGFINFFKTELKNCLSVPLVWKKDIIGAINVFNKLEDRFDKEDEKILSILASQAAMILKSAKLYKELKNAASALALLYEISKTINEGRSCQDILTLILKKGIEIFDAQNGSIMLIDETSGDMNIRVAEGLSDEVIRTTRKRPGDGSIAGWVAEKEEPLLLIGKVKDPRFTTTHQKEKNKDVKDAMCAPLKIKNKVIGVINISNQIGHDIFTESDLNFLCTIANEISMVIETARLYEITVQRVSELSTFYVISNALSSVLNLQDVLKQILDRVSALIPDAMLTINTIDARSNTLQVIAHSGFKTGTRPLDEIILNERLKEVLRLPFTSRRPIVLQTVESISDIKPLVSNMSAEALVLLPLIAREHEVGILLIASGQPYTPSKEELRLLMSIAQAAATAMENARLYGMLKKKVEELEGLQEIASKMSLSTNPRDILANSINIANHVIKSELGFLYLWDEDSGRFVAKVGQGKKRISESLFKSLKFKPDEGTIGWVATHNEALIIDDTRQDNRFTPLSEVSVKDIISVPIIEDGKVKGVMEFFNKLTSEGFSEDDKRFLSILSNQISIFLENTNSFEEIKRRALQLSAVHAINRMTSMVEVKNLINQVLELTAKVMRVKKSYYSSLLLPENIIKITGSYGLTYMEQEKEEKISIGQGIAGRVIQNNAPVVINNVKNDPTLSDEEKAIYVEDSYLGVPMSIRGKVVGSLSVASKITDTGFDSQDVELLTTISSQAAIAIEYADVSNKLQKYSDEVIKLLTLIIEARDSFVRTHSDAVCKYATAIAKELGLPQDEIDTIARAALLHDIGKIGIREGILLKPETELNSDEFREMKNHPFIGVQILKSLNFLAPIISLVYHHHELYDGSGYPDNLVGESIPNGARIIAIADVFDRMVTSRGSYTGMSDEEATIVLRRGAGKKFDPMAVEAFIRIHSIVRREEMERGRLRKRDVRDEGRKEIQVGSNTIWDRYA